MEGEILEQDHLLIDAIKNGSQTAFERFFKQHYSQLCGFAFGYVQNSDEAEDLVQNAFFTIWQKRENLSPNQSLKSYVYTAVKNACFNKLKSQKVRDEYGQLAVANEEHSIDAQELLQEAELSERINAAINAMPTERQRIFLMSRNDGLKYKEIAEKLGKSIKTVENQMGKALKYMREELADFLALIIFFNFF